jgi:hypothetical protein
MEQLLLEDPPLLGDKRCYVITVAIAVEREAEGS